MQIVPCTQNMPSGHSSGPHSMKQSSESSPALMLSHATWSSNPLGGCGQSHGSVQSEKKHTPTSG